MSVSTGWVTGDDSKPGASRCNRRLWHHGPQRLGARPGANEARWPLPPARGLHTGRTLWYTCWPGAPPTYGRRERVLEFPECLRGRPPGGVVGGRERGVGRRTGRVGGVGWEAVARGCLAGRAGAGAAPSRAGAACAGRREWRGFGGLARARRPGEGPCATRRVSDRDPRVSRLQGGAAAGAPGGSRRAARRSPRRHSRPRRLPPARRQEEEPAWHAQF